MARRLGAEQNEMRFKDNLSGSDIVLIYRMPTTQERVAYTNESFQRKANKVVQKTVQTRQKFGAKILAGFRDGDFEIKGPDGKWMPIASDPKSEHFYEGWKAHVEQHASDLVELLAIRVFDVPVVAQEAEDGEDAEGEDPN